jgi:hypothetical protein
MHTDSRAGIALRDAASVKLRTVPAQDECTVTRTNFDPKQGKKQNLVPRLGK